jgi:hypothetical protein
MDGNEWNFRNSILFVLRKVDAKYWQKFIFSTFSSYFYSISFCFLDETFLWSCDEIRKRNKGEMEIIMIIMLLLHNSSVHSLLHSLLWSHDWYWNQFMMKWNMRCHLGSMRDEMLFMRAKFISSISISFQFISQNLSIYFSKYFNVKQSAKFHQLIIINYSSSYSLSWNKSKLRRSLVIYSEFCHHCSLTVTINLVLMTEGHNGIKTRKIK